MNRLEEDNSARASGSTDGGRRLERWTFASWRRQTHRWRSSGAPRVCFMCVFVIANERLHGEQRDELLKKRYVLRKTLLER